MSGRLFDIKLKKCSADKSPARCFKCPTGQQKKEKNSLEIVSNIRPSIFGKNAL